MSNQNKDNENQDLKPIKTGDGLYIDYGYSFIKYTTDWGDSFLKYFKMIGKSVMRLYKATPEYKYKRGMRKSYNKHKKKKS